MPNTIPDIPEIFDLDEFDLGEHEHVEEVLEQQPADLAGGWGVAHGIDKVNLFKAPKPVVKPGPVPMDEDVFEEGDIVLISDLGDGFFAPEIEEGDVAEIIGYKVDNGIPGDKTRKVYDLRFIGSKEGMTQVANASHITMFKKGTTEYVDRYPL